MLQYTLGIAMNRENIVNALLKLLSSSVSFTTVSRKFQTWSSISSSEKPAMFLLERSESYIRANEAVPEVVTLEIDLYICVDAGKDQSLVPASVLNNLIDAVEAALTPNKLTNSQTLGGLVSHCRIEGKIIKNSGDLDGDATAIIPIKILVPR